MKNCFEGYITSECKDCKKKFTLKCINNMRQDAIYKLQEMQHTDDLVDLGMEIDRVLRVVEDMKARLEDCDEY